MACVSTSLADTVDVCKESPSVVPQISSADLPYAMTTRKNPRPAPPLATMLIKEASCSKPNETNSIDSGYASAFSTSGSHTLETGTAEASQKDGNGLSRSKFLQRKTTELKPFYKTVPVAAQDRFKDLNEIFGEPLYDYVTKNGATYSAISIKLKMLGESEDTAKPWIVVLCDKGVAKRVKRFFSQSWVKSECQQCHTDPCRPCFEVLVYDRPPIPMSATSPASVYTDWRSDASECLTLCGSIIGVNTESNTRIATLGGVLSVTMAGGDTELYCMTVSHVIAGAQQEEDIHKLEDAGGEEVSREEEEDLEEEDSDEAMEADFFSSESQVYTLDLGFEGDMDTCAIDVVNQNPRTGDSIPSRLKIGYIAITSHDVLEDGNNLDWGLIKIEDPSLYCPNLLLIPGDSDQGHILCEPEPLTTSKSETASSVFLLSGTRGVIRGMLSFTPSSLMLAPGTRFTDIFTLRLSNGLDLNAGDCGSWVVDSHTHEVYGHVVAMDAFGEAYVIPMKETFRCIQKQLSAQHVCLPREYEVQEWIRQSLNEPASYVFNGGQPQHFNGGQPPHFNGHITEPRELPHITEPRELECPFHQLFCLMTFSNIEDWISHSLEHFKKVPPPHSNRCCFCPAVFDCPTDMCSWRQRMRHIASHHQLGHRLATARPDFELSTYLWNNRLIEDADYRDLKGNYEDRLRRVLAYPFQPASPLNQQSSTYSETEKERCHNEVLTAESLRKDPTTLPSYQEQNVLTSRPSPLSGTELSHECGWHDGVNSNLEKRIGLVGS